MDEFLIYLLGVVISFISSVITFRFGVKSEDIDYDLTMPMIILVWLMSWIGAVVMLSWFIICKIIDSPITGKLYKKLTNGFIKLVEK